MRYALRGFTHLIFDVESQHPIYPKFFFEYASLDWSNEIYYRNATSYIHTVKNYLKKKIGKIKQTFIKFQIIMNNVLIYSIRFIEKVDK